MNHPESKRPWHREPWVWLLIAIPASAVVAGAVTLYLAIDSNDGLVEDDYYWRGKHINRVLARDDRAAQLGISATLAPGEAAGTLALQLEAADAGVLPSTLGVHWLHATRAGHDRVVTAQRQGPYTYVMALPELAAGRWHIQAEGGDWRITGSMQMPGPMAARLGPDVVNASE